MYDFSLDKDDVWFSNIETWAKQGTYKLKDNVLNLKGLWQLGKAVGMGDDPLFLHFCVQIYLLLKWHT